MSGCSGHPLTPAWFRCQGCERALCRDCIREGHRLLFCVYCGEQALPLEPGAAATSRDLRREERLRVPYTLADALLYPFRGNGAYLLWGYVLILSMVDLLPLVGCLSLVLRVFIGLLLPGLVFAIARETADGGDELPDWPDLTEYLERLGEVVVFIGITLGAALPVLGLLSLAGCEDPELAARSPLCWLAVALGIPLGAAFWVPAVGATGSFGSFWLTFRLDLHARALAAAGSEAVKIVAAAAGLLVGWVVLTVLVARVPYLVVFAANLLFAFWLFTSAHLAGLLFRRREAALAAIYLE